MIIIGHRGAAGRAPENTLPSFALALELGCLWLELDVHLSADGDLVVIHDALLERTTSGRGAVQDHRTFELQNMDAGGGAAVPTLHEVATLLSHHLQQSPAKDLTLNIELKGAATGEAVALFLKQHTLPFAVLISSFDHNELRRFRKIDSNTPLAPLYAKWQPNWHETAVELGATYVNLGNRITTPKRVAEIVEKGLKVCVYTINNKRRAERLQRWGVSGVFTDYPDRLGAAGSA